MFDERFLFGYARYDHAAIVCRTTMSSYAAPQTYHTQKQAPAYFHSSPKDAEALSSLELPALESSDIYS